ncbi:type I-E CRISPR-associated protein Cas6/Cse3/CasE [Methanosphaerula palustris]|uniref:CRISPR-associated protein, Cse3 family n=1 Tax=Methanosphaerula palustris (strain ATCC BAA-1556 / DSM 19958 / E1-9c) TaxID=521011 RepID=B8GIV2_METPE|nr:type I-E CRISPR-associated protein Cas6/Cse3/CasE [Methanosphaerula palustris]ACL16915.1 CRISPR-associated protein, Cse3 family [Methanosphaerula palustris E1-9c]
MQISKIQLNADASDHPAFWEHVGGAYQAHSLIWDLFSDGPERERDFLFRQEVHQGMPVFWTVSERVPSDRNETWNIKSKPYAPILRQGMHLSFVLRANPIRSRRDDLGKQHRHDVVMDMKTALKDSKPGDQWPAEDQIIQEAGLVWLANQGNAKGFSLQDGAVRVDGYTQHRFVKPKKKQMVQISTLDFTGLLTVTDPERFTTALFNGIGPAKGFGCGLMMVRPA